MLEKMKTIVKIEQVQIYDAILKQMMIKNKLKVLLIETFLSMKVMVI